MSLHEDGVFHKPKRAQVGFPKETRISRIFLEHLRDTMYKPANSLIFYDSKGFRVEKWFFAGQTVITAEEDIHPDLNKLVELDNFSFDGRALSVTF